MELPNRKQRRLLAKQAGLLKLKSKSTFKDQIEMIERSIEVGHQIHLRNTERNLRENDKLEQDNEQKRILSYIDQGMTEKQAIEAVQNENELNNK